MRVNLRIVMKSMYVLFALLFFTFTLIGQEVKVPKVLNPHKDMNIPGDVKSSFRNHFPNASEIKWGTEKHNEYKVGFEDDGKYVSVVINKKGTIKEIKTLISLSELPKSIAKVIAKRYSGFYIATAYKIIGYKGKVTFGLEITKEKERKELRFNHEGIILPAKK